MCGLIRKHLSNGKMVSNSLKQVRKFNVLGLFLTIVCLKISSVVAYFERCDHTYQLNPGYSYLESPYYPDNYPAGSSCRYKFVAPLDYSITINCTIKLKKEGSACTTEHFYVATDGDEYLRDSEEFCGAGTFVRKSNFRSVVMAYTSQCSCGRFRCQMYVAPQPCDCGWTVKTKIVNGQETKINEYPSMVALQTTTGYHPFCAGSIIAHNYILTAAHCTRQEPNPANIIVLAGDHNLASNIETKYAATYRIAQIIEHPSYTSDPVKNDIALLRTTTPIEWSRGVGPICLPPVSSANKNFAYSYVDIIGWGTTSFAGAVSDTLQKITVIVIENDSCASTYSDTIIYPSQLCTYDYTGSSKDSCQYDSGGPVILGGARQYLLACISFGKFCGQGGYATGVNTRITSYLSWIYQNTGYTTCNVNM